MDYKKLASTLMDIGTPVRVASNEDHSITLIDLDLGRRLGEFLVLWIDDACRVYNLYTQSRRYEMLRQGFGLKECVIAGEVWPAEQYNTIFD